MTTATPAPDDSGRPVAAVSYLHARRRELGKDPVWLTRHSRPLAEVVDDQLTFDDVGQDGCDSGWCMT